MGRGPSYPYVDLEGAIALARKVYDYAKKGSAPVESVITEAFKFSATSSSGDKVLAALRAFELIKEASGANGKSIKVSNRAIRILLDDPESAERHEEIKKATLSPKWYEYCWSKWGKEMPPAMRSNLLIEHGFVESTVDSFLANYRKSIAFAGLLDDVIFKEDGESTDENKDRFSIGDWVQWKTQGCLRLPKPSRILAFLDDGKFATVEWNPTNPVPVAELIPVKSPESNSSQIAAQIVPSPAVGGIKMLTETLNSSAGIVVQIHWPSEINKVDYDDFVYLLEGVRRKIERAVKVDLVPTKEISEPDVALNNESR